MPIKFNSHQEDLLCWFCLETYENKRELEIHSYIHSACGEEIVPIFNLIKVNNNSEIQEVKGTVEKHATGIEVDTDNSASEAVNELSSLGNVVQEEIVTSCDSEYSISDAVNELSLLKDNVENGNFKSCDNGYAKSDTVSDSNLLQRSDDGVVKSCDSYYTKSDEVNELNLLKNNVEDESAKSSDSGYSSPVQASPEKVVNIVNPNLFERYCKQ